MQQIPPRPLNFRVLGRSGLRVAEAALGALTFGQRWGYGCDESVSRKILDAYTAAGGNLIDTANAYNDGESEQILGRLLRGRRDRYVVASKYSFVVDPRDRNSGGNHRRAIRRSIEDSLRRLGTDYIDLYWLHAWDWTTPADEVMRALDDAIRSGKILHVGVSDTPAWMISRANTLAELRGWSSFVGMQIEYNLLERSAERELIPMAHHLDITAMPWGVVGGGMLAGIYTRGEDTEPGRKRSNERRMSERNFEIAREVDRIADELGWTSAQLALAWVKQRVPQALPVLGARSSEQLEEQLDALGFEIPVEHFEHLEALTRPDMGFPHDFVSTERLQMLIYGKDRDRFVNRPRGPYAR